MWSSGPKGCVCPEGTEFAELLGVCAPPRSDRPVDMGAVRGVTSFSMVVRSSQYQVGFWQWIHQHGWNTGRIGAQVEGDWCDENDRDGVDSDGDGEDNDGDYLPCGPRHGSPEWETDLIRMLEVSARIPDTWIQLIPTFTRKSDNPGRYRNDMSEPEKERAGRINMDHFNAMFDRVNAIVQAGDYKHIAWDQMNEPVHPLSQHIKDEHTAEMLLHIQANSDLPLGVDYHGGVERESFHAYTLEEMDLAMPEAVGEWLGRYPFAWRDKVDYIAFHTPRNPEPSLERMRWVDDRWGYTRNNFYGVEKIWLDETVAYAGDAIIEKYNLRGRGTIVLRGYGTEELRIQQVARHLRNGHMLGWVVFYHSVEGIQNAPDEKGNFVPFRIPTYNKDIAIAHR